MGLVVSSAQSFGEAGCTSFSRYKTLQYPNSKIINTEITEPIFKKATEKFESFFNEYLDDWKRHEVIVFKSWRSNSVNAFAEKEDGKILITIYGGLARHPAITLDGFEAVLCHELGHHLGGFPKKSGNVWSSAEGQADYYASSKCLRIYWELEDNITWVKNHSVSDFVLAKCALSNPSSAKEAALCSRISMAGLSVAKMIQALDYETVDPEFHTPDPSVVRVTQMLHPYSQCRLDTLFNGALCSVRQDIAFDDKDEHIGSCHEKNGDTVGLRPKCWFKPN